MSEDNHTPYLTSIYSTPTTAELAKALALAQMEMGPAAKDAANPYFRSKYADLASAWDACRLPLARHGLSVVQCPTADGARVTVRTILLHESGERIASDLTITAQRQLKDGGGWEKVDSPQAVGSTITYARRYSLMAMVGIAPDDDDGEAAEGRGFGVAQAVTRQLAAARPAAPAPPPWPVGLAKLWPNRSAMEQAFASLRPVLGDATYTSMLATHDITPQLKGTVRGVLDAYEAMAQRAEEARHDA